MTTTQESAPQTPITPPPPERRGWFTAYREDQGRHARMAAFWSLTLLLIFGVRFLHDILIQWVWMRTALQGIRIPVVGVNLSPAFLVTFSAFAAGMLFLHRWLQRPKIADLLIDTEAELRKVTWPKPQEAWNAAMVVIVSVMLLGVFLAVADVFLYRVMRYLILGGT